MKQLILLGCFLVTFARAEGPPEEYYSPQDAYSKGFKDGWREGYEHARKEHLGAEYRPGRPVPVAPAPAYQPTYPITISLAKYGTPSRACDATHKIARHFNGKISASLDVTNELCGDPAPGERKSLDITYICGNRVKNATAFEHRSIYLSCSD